MRNRIPINVYIMFTFFFYFRWIIQRTSHALLRFLQIILCTFFQIITTDLNIYYWFWAVARSLQLFFRLVATSRANAQRRPKEAHRHRWWCYEMWWWFLLDVMLVYWWWLVVLVGPRNERAPHTHTHTLHNAQKISYLPMEFIAITVNIQSQIQLKHFSIVFHTILMHKFAK